MNLMNTYVPVLIEIADISFLYFFSNNCHRTVRTYVRMFDYHSYFYSRLFVRKHVRRYVSKSMVRIGIEMVLQEY